MVSGIIFVLFISVFYSGNMNIYSVNRPDVQAKNNFYTG
jgi:hypothetical protein